MIFTPNIIITKDFGFVKKFLTSDRLGELANSIDPGQTFASFRSNKYVYALEHEYNYSSDKGQSELTLSITDPDGNFEETFFDESFLQSMLVAKFKEFVTSKISISQLDNVFMPKISNGFKVFVAYGVGEDLENWSDPIVCYMMAADFLMTNNSLRTYVYKFVPILSNLLRPQIKLDEEGSNPQKDTLLGGKSVLSVELEVTREKLSDVEFNLNYLMERYIEKLHIGKEVISLLPMIGFDGKKFDKNVLTEGEKTFRYYFSVFLPAKEDLATNDLKNLYKQKFNIDVVPVNPEVVIERSREKRGATPAPARSDSDLEADSNKKITKYRLIMSAESGSTNENIEGSETHNPDFWAPLNHISNGVNSFLGDSSLPFQLEVYVEDSSRFLELFKKYNLIKDSSEPCILIGDKQLIRDLVYANSTSLNNLTSYRSMSKANPELLRIVTSLKDIYLSDIIVNTKKKSSSSFGEVSYVDELALKIPKELGITTQNLDIPVFTNNVRNSNILSLSIKNSSNYFSFVSTAVRDNRLKSLLDPLTNDYGRQLLERYNLSVAAMLEIFKVAKAEFDSIPIESRRTFEALLTDQTSKKRLVDFRETKLKNYGILEAYEDDFLVLSDILKNFDNSLVYNESFRKLFLKQEVPILFSESDENISILNKLLQTEISKRLLIVGNELTSKELVTLSQIIILLNDINQVDASMEVIPGKNGPNSSFILKSILDYMQKYTFAVGIKTLPFYHLSNLRTINKPSILYSERVNLVGYELPEYTKLDPFTGLYYIRGFRHVLTSRECYSEFSLTKMVGSADYTGKK